VPQLDVLRHADVAVVHGGANTVDECVLAGVPMLIYCGYETDMAGNTARVEHHGLGIAGDRRRDDPATIGGRVGRLLDEPHFTDNMRRFQRIYEGYAERRVAERAVEGLLSRPREIGA
jgi:UDP:flavonoid glycosyltransferase YjiC (YdhE family)